MAHFAKLDENNNVLAVHVVVNDVIMVDGVESEQAGIDFLTDLHKHSSWKQTSYNAATNGFRKNYAQKSGQYLPQFNAFIGPSPYPSWKLNYTTFQWESPVAQPNEFNNSRCVWSEINKEWIQVATLSN